MENELENLKKQLQWFNDFADVVQYNHRVYEDACEQANEKEEEREIKNNDK